MYSANYIVMHVCTKLLLVIALRLFTMYKPFVELENGRHTHRQTDRQTDKVSTVITPRVHACALSVNYACMAKLIIKHEISN